MEDDDTDFTPSSPRNTSSNLANLFGFTKKPLQGNSSLTYTAPRAPKKEVSPAKKQPEEKTKGKIIFSKAVQAYKLENRSYVSQGLIGIVISGNHTSRIYEIILYKRTKEHLCQTRILDSFGITLSPNKYVSFYDNNKQNWSLMFQTIEDVEQFSQKVAICKFYSHQGEPSDVVVQDLEPPSEQKTNTNNSVEVIYSVFSLIPEELSKVKGEIKEEMKLDNYSFTHLSNGLTGCAVNCKRIILIPHSLSGPWLSVLGPNKDLLIEIKIEKIITQLENAKRESTPPVEGAPESPIDSSAEETTIKARGVSIKEALASTKSQKANLISRMARMGQATLPVKKGLSAGPSDSDEENALASNPKPRVSRSRNAAAVGNSFSQTMNQELPQQLSVYQNDLAWHQAQKLGVAYQQLIPVSASPITSPTSDPNMSVYVSESRIQATELRMGISKISEKLDLVWNKIQNMSGGGGESKGHQQTLMDSGGILTSIQNIITENENLKGKVEEQKGKIEQQNDRIFNLLELNHKYLEQNSTSHDKQSASESKLKTEMESLHRRELEMETANKAALERVKTLEEDLSRSEQTNQKLRKRVEELDAEAAELKRNAAEKNDDKTKELENLKEKASETVARLKEKLREVTSENENLKTVIKNQKEEIETGSREVENSRTRNEEYEKAVEGLKQQILDGESRNDSRVEGLSKTVARLEEENKSLKGKMERENQPVEMKTILGKIFSGLKLQFTEGKEYTASQILTTISTIFHNETNGGFEKAEEEKKEGSEKTETVQPVVVPAPRTSLLESKSGVEDERKEGSSPKEDAKKEEEKKESDHQKKKEEDDSWFKSYDQGWRTTKPPTPPLYDDEDDDDDEWLN